MKIRLLSVGRPRKDILKITQDYIERAGKMFPVEHQWVKDGGGTSSEGERLLTASTGKMILLTRKGRRITSLDLAKLVQDALLMSTDLTFVIGGADGVSKKLADKANEKISISSMTLQHDLALLFLAEQVYRSFTILKNIPYHR